MPSPSSGACLGTRGRPRGDRRRGPRRGGEDENVDHDQRQAGTTHHDQHDRHDYPARDYHDNHGDRQDGDEHDHHDVTQAGPPGKSPGKRPLVDDRASRGGWLRLARCREPCDRPRSQVCPMRHLGVTARPSRRLLTVAEQRHKRRRAARADRRASSPIDAVVDALPKPPRYGSRCRRPPMTLASIGAPTPGLEQGRRSTEQCRRRIKVGSPVDRRRSVQRTPGCSAAPGRRLGRPPKLGVRSRSRLAFHARSRTGRPCASNRSRRTAPPARRSASIERSSHNARAAPDADHALGSQARTRR